jgi:hypothetical protein
MPAFTFEKISPPVDDEPTPPTKKLPKPSSGLVGKIVNRLSEARAKKTLRRQPAQSSD